MQHVGILLFNDVEVLDFAGPFEVFAVTGQTLTTASSPFLVKTVSEDGKIVTARNGLKIQPDYSYADAPQFDILIIPGGPGSRTEMYNKATIKWVQERMDKVDIMASVCTGALILAEAGLLDGKTVTTHWNSYDRLESDYPSLTVKRNVKFVDEGKIVTSGGISAGINMSFHLVNRLLGKEVATNTAKMMDYDIDLDQI
ncbi:DJ-1/PfpI family protein [Paenibacillus apiarius]|uniref:DJ-1/PfpI family protein n=1 Tax=Paenibacillus apiarius TaxID=46240 RepID=A0ABT4DQZ9_9BACL|nr:DJ-1/PfpI family protein [Paenibacillus apiarius]MCY9514543.1 DJ-1/PfpI family protein [Paenibacillus apiarius]MCY9518533.1 DJ-1/PfpI family protein [Paenibacillus apiarius]MCY9552621.1 DJ-1/PfpI family protein [Paenibacillus apiarius]MCY9557051.1 DJ-1/PfpI family protein [Paenibacillus apiarius]MCY9685996.1 DJ-1/PfpI family protein [Paenibacillus apiarius]